MQDSRHSEPPTGLQTAATCLECERTIDPGQERRTTDEGVFCRPCWDQLTREVEAALAKQGEGINWVNAVLGAVLGALAGILAWWGFTVLTKISFGLVAVVIGFTVGKGILLLTGGKRSTGLQGLSVLVAVAAFGYASYLVNRTFLLKAIAGDPQYAGATIPWIAAPGYMLDVIGVGFGIMDLVFLAIVAYQAWKVPAPVRLT
jgi:hypothetical protein